jgi:NTP pyrophosphatase (non-canonical NTP hydrolase)
MKHIIEKLRKFRDDRNWAQFHTPENLAKSVVLEASELLENYQWGRSEDIDPQNVKEEIADIVGYCLLICDHYGFDLEAALEEKIALNEKKYPVNKAYGKADKYNKL